MPISSVFQVVSEDPEQIESLVTTLNGYVTTTAASETAAATSETNAAASETNAAASAAAALASENAAASSAADAASDASTASAASINSANSATNAQDWAVKTIGLVDSTDYASKAWAIGGTGVTGGDGASKEWSTLLGSTVDGSEYSAKHYSQVAASEAADAAADAVATAADRVQTGLDVIAAAGSATAASNSQIAAASSAAAAAATLDTFDDRYLGSYASDPTVDNDGNALITGALYFSSTANEMRVYDGGNWIAASSAGGASLLNYNFTATAAQTAFSGADDNSNTLSYTVDNLIVTRNGVVLEDGTDYTATDGSTITLAVAAVSGDEINVVAFKSFTTADMVSATNGGAFQGNVDFAAGIDVTGNVTVTGTVDGRDVATDGTKLDGIEAGADVTDTANVTAAGALMTTGGSVTGDVSFGNNNRAIFGSGGLQIYHDSADSVITEQGTGSLYIGADSTIALTDAAVTQNKAQFITGGAVNLFHNNALKLATTATGVDVTGYIDYGPSSGNIGKIGFDSNNVYIGSTSGTGSIHFRNNIGSTDAPHSSGDDKMVITDSGVGIGTSSPSAKLETKVSRTSGANVDAIILSDDVTGAQTSGYGTRIVGLSNNGSAESAIGFEAFGGTNNDTGLGFYTQAAAGGLTRQMTIDSIGRVGIGTTIPSVKLNVQNDSSTAYNPSTSAFNTLLSLKNSTSGASNNAIMSFTTESNGEWYIGGVQNSGNTASDFVFASRDSGARAERLRIKSNGVVSQKGDNGWESKIFFSGDGTGPYIQVKTNIRRNTNIMYYAHIIGHKSYTGARVNTILTGYAYSAYIGTQSSQYHGYSNLGTHGIQDVYYSSDNYMCFTIDSDYSAYSMTLGTNMNGYSLSTQPDILSYTNTSSTTRYY